MFGNDSFDFGSISLGGVQAATGGSVLPKGRYICKTKDAKLEDTKAKDGSKRISVRLVDTGGKGVITDNINVFLKGKAEATRIGLEHLKALAVHGGHPDPDNIGQYGIASLNDLTVGVNVGTEMYEGEERSRVKGYCATDSVKTGGAPASAPKAGSIGGGSTDDIPF